MVLILKPIISYGLVWKQLRMVMLGMIGILLSRNGLILRILLFLLTPSLLWSIYHRIVGLWRIEGDDIVVEEAMDFVDDIILMKMILLLKERTENL